jgi:ribonuclease BN (tRNA processing enzyme)
MIELTVLGTYAAWPGPGGAASGYLLTHDGFHLVVDFGPGVLSTVQRHVAIDRIDAVVVSHKHLDHCLDLVPLFLARTLREEALPPLELISPPGVLGALARLDDPGDQTPLPGGFALREVEPGGAFDVGPFGFETRLLPHAVPNMGMRITAGGSTLAYTGDTGPSEGIEILAEGADALLAEASWLDGQGAGIGPIHLTARQASEHAARAGVPHLVLTHFWPTVDRTLSRAQAAEAYEGTLTMAQENLRIAIGD